METRLEKRRRKKIKSIFEGFKYLIVIILTILLGNRINAVNNTIVELNCMENTNLIYYDNTNNHLELFGSLYYLDLKFIKRYL